MNPAPRRGPRFSDSIYVGGIAMAIEALPLYQPDAPKAYLVEAPRGTSRRITWDGLRWATESASDVLGASPVSSGVKAEHTEAARPPRDERHAGGTEPSAAAGETPQTSPVDTVSRRSARPAHTRLVQVKRTTRDGGESTCVRRKDVALPPALQALHDRLDAAREKYDKARDDGDGNRMFDLMEEYSTCILAVDQADPGFYLGRIKPLDPLPRYVPPELDYAGISSRMTFPDSFGVAHVGEERPTAAGGICRVCGCTDNDCSGCIERTGAPCHWVEPDLCSACAMERIQ